MIHPNDTWIISNPGEPTGKLICIRCSQPVDRTVEYNEAEERAEDGYKCHVCGLFTWKAHIEPLRASVCGCGFVHMAGERCGPF